MKEPEVKRIVEGVIFTMDGSEDEWKAVVGRSRYGSNERVYIVRVYKQDDAWRFEISERNVDWKITEKMLGENDYKTMRQAGTAANEHVTGWYTAKHGSEPDKSFNGRT